MAAAGRWRYVEMVWSEIVGATAVLLVRRLAELADLDPFGVRFSTAAMGASLGVEPSEVRHTLTRLDRLALISTDEDRAVVGVSGLAPAVPPDLVNGLSVDGGWEHRWWVAESSDARLSPVPRAVGRAAASRCGGGRSR
jgi:hypothetical protein